MMNCIGCRHRNVDNLRCSRCVGWNYYEPIGFRSQKLPDITKELVWLGTGLRGAVENKAKEKVNMGIKKVIFSYPATVVLWEDGTKTVVKCGFGEFFDKEKGLAMAIAKKALGNTGGYYEVFKKWMKEDDEPKIEEINGRIKTKEPSVSGK